MATDTPASSSSTPSARRNSARSPAANSDLHRIELDRYRAYAGNQFRALRQFLMHLADEQEIPLWPG